MVENAYKVTLVVAFVPLFAGLFWKRANLAGAYWSIGLGLLVWLPLDVMLKDPEIPAQFYGFGTSLLGMVVDSLAPGSLAPSSLAPSSLAPTRR